MLHNIRCWLIKTLVGKMPTMINMKVTRPKGNPDCKLFDFSQQGLYAKCCFDGNSGDRDIPVILEAIAPMSYDEIISQMNVSN